MAKLHEVLAVEKSLESSSKKMVKESLHTLGKENLFRGMVKTYNPFNEEDASHLSTNEQVNLESTVDENIDYVSPIIADYWDAVLQKDATNQLAKADIVDDSGQTIATNVPATFLLGLESKLNELRNLYLAIPTLAPGIPWIEDKSNSKANVYTIANPLTTFKTEKITDFRVVVEPTEHHPAQIKEVQKTENVGKYETVHFSGMMPPVEKARRLANLDKLLIAVRKARARANQETLVKVEIGQSLMDYINK